MKIDKQTTNIAIVEGILQEVDLKEGKMKGDKDYVAGTVTIRVSQKLGSVIEESEIPVSVFASKLKNDGNPNPAYASVTALATNFISMAADKDKADKIRFTSGQIFENKFIGRDGNLVTGYRIRNSFFTKVTSDFTSRAIFRAKPVLISIKEEIGKDEIPTGRLLIKAALVQYGSKVDVVDFVVEDPEAVSYVSDNWHENDTLNVAGKIRYISEEVERAGSGDVGFGEDIPDVYTRTKRELVITTGSPAGMDEDESYDLLEIDAALKARKAEIENMKANQAGLGKTEKGKFDLSSSGF